MDQGESYKTEQEIDAEMLKRLSFTSDKTYGEYLMRTGKDKQNKLKHKLLSKSNAHRRP